LGMDCEPAAGDSREVEQIIAQRAQAHRLPQCHVQLARGRLTRLRGVVDEGLETQLQRGERSSELVRGNGEKHVPGADALARASRRLSRLLYCVMSSINRNSTPAKVEMPQRRSTHSGLMSGRRSPEPSASTNTPTPKLVARRKRSGRLRWKNGSTSNATSSG